MRSLTAATLALALAPAGGASAQEITGASDALGRVAPALEAYSADTLDGEVWQRPDLSARDRSLITVATLIARDQVDDLTGEVGRALDNGVSPQALSETVTHLGFYSGWGNAAAAAEAMAPVFEDRGIERDALASADPELAPLDEEAVEAQRQSVQDTWGATSQGVVDYTIDTLFRDLWRRPGLEPRERSLVTVSALIAMGRTGALEFHLGRAMDNGVTKAEASEVLTHLAFYAGWPQVFAALPTAKAVFAERGG